MNVTNQKPAELSPVYKSTAKGQFDPVASMRETIADPLFTPYLANTKASIQENGTDITPDDITNRVIACCQDIQDMNSEVWCKELFSKTLVHFDKSTNFGVNELFTIQSAIKAKLQFPTQTIVYSPGTDVIPVSRKFLAGSADYDEYFGTMAFYARPETLGFYFANEIVFNDFKTWFDSQCSILASVLPAQTNQLVTDFKTLSLNGLTESLLLRNDDSENNDEFSFARLLISLMMNYTTQVGSGEFGVLPFSLAELYCPRSVVFINIEKHAHASPSDVKKEWDIIKQSTQMPIKMISNNKLTKLTAAARSIQKIASAAATAASPVHVGRAAFVPFKPKAPARADFTKMVSTIIKKMGVVNRSENSYKSVKMTFQKPNRRDPDDFNKKGKSVSVKYYPDIHLYVDCSGSISEDYYRDAVLACMQLARKFNINMYFNSFSSYLSQCTKLKLKDKTLKQAWAEFQKVVKVSGGTDYEPIWRYINQSPKRRREFSLIITDFEWFAPRQFIEHPKNLYYMPCTGTNYQQLMHYAESFCKSVMHNDPDIRKHLLF